MQSYRYVSNTPKRIESRRKSIEKTKLHSCYETYARLVPKQLRRPELADSWHPNTPNINIDCSISQWNNALSIWRHRVYKWIDVPKESHLQIQDAVQRGNVNDIVDACSSSACTQDENIDPIITPCDIASIKPIIYKPKWFKGQITQPGFTTLCETQFKSDLLKLQSAEANAHMQSFYTEVLKQYTNDDQ